MYVLSLVYDTKAKKQSKQSMFVSLTLFVIELSKGGDHWGEEEVEEEREKMIHNIAKSLCEKETAKRGRRKKLFSFFRLASSAFF